VVKDGRHTPAQYLFSLANWSGKEAINLSDFWPAGGSISHVAIYQGPIIATPEPATIVFVLLALTFLAVPVRRMGL
jgi:hypothetical protein